MSNKKTEDFEKLSVERSMSPPVLMFDNRRSMNPWMRLIFFSLIEEGMGNRISNKVVQAGRAHHFNPFCILNIFDTMGII